MTNEYTGFPRFTAAPTIIPRITTTRLSGVVPAAFHFSIQDTLMPGASLENGITVYPWRDCHVEWDFGDASGTGRMVDPRTGATVNPNTDQVGPDAVYVYETPGTYTVTAKVKARKGIDQYTEATTTSVRVNQIQRIFIPGSTNSGGSFLLGWGGNWTAPIGYEVPSYTLGPPEVNVQGQGSMYEVLAALETLPGLAGNIRSAGVDCVSASLGWFYLIEFCNGLGGQSNALIQMNCSGLVNPMVKRTDKIRAHYGTTTGGEFRITNSAGLGIPAFTTAQLPFNATSAELQAAINNALNTALSTTGVNYCLVTSRLGLSGGEIVGDEATITQQSEWYIEWQSPYNSTTYASMTISWPVPAVGSSYLYTVSKYYKASQPFDTAAVEFQAGGTAAHVTVTDGNMVTRHYDPVNGNNLNDGLTEEAPRKTWADMKTWLDGATSNQYRRALWKRGTTIPDNATISTALRYARIGAYGTGARPILGADVDLMTQTVSTNGTTRGVETKVWDVAFSDLNFGCKPARWITANQADQNPEPKFGHVLWKNCLVRRHYELTGSSAILRDMAWWGCTFSGEEYNGNMAKTQCSWISYTGCDTYVGRYNLSTLHPSGSILEHVWYPGEASHLLMRWGHCRNGTQPSELNCWLRGTVEELPGPVHCWYVCDSLVSGTVAGVACASGGAVYPWFRNNNTNRGMLDACVVSGVWIKPGSTTGVVIARISSGTDPKTGGGTYANGAVNPEMPVELLQRVAQPFSFANCWHGVVRDCRVWPGQMVGRSWEMSTILPGEYRTNGIVLVQPPNPHGNAAATFGLAGVQIYGNQIWGAGIGAVISWSGGPYIYCVENVISCPGTRSGLFRCWKDDSPPYYLKRNSFYVEGDSTRTVGNKAWDYGGTELTLAAAIAAGHIDPSNVVREPKWRDGKNGNMDSTRGASLGAIPVKISNSRGWPRGDS
jgi:hypothetical protein